MQNKTALLPARLLVSPARLLASLAITLIIVLPASKIPTGVKTGQNAAPEEFTTYLDNRIPIIMDNYNIPGVCMALIIEGETRWMGAYGYADLKEGREMTTSTICRVESISKPVTAWGVMKLVEQGVIDTDMPVAAYLKSWQFPESEYHAERITVGHLLSHTAGLPLGDIASRYSPKGNIPSLKESLSAEAVLRQEPGSGFNYSNTGFNLLELLIEEVTGRAFTEYMEAEVLIPLGMNNSSFSWSEGMEPPVPMGYTKQGKAVPVHVYHGKASGGLFAGVEDIAAFVAAGMEAPFRSGHEVLSPKYISKLYACEAEDLGLYGLVFDAYGSGHFIENLFGGEYAVSHGGQGYGWMTHFHSVPATGDGIVILTNSQRSWPFFASILGDWAQWRGFGRIGMGKINLGQKIVWALIGMILFVSLWQVLRPGRGLLSGSRQFAPLYAEGWPVRLLQVTLSIFLLTGLLWAVNQDYLFLSSVFPIASVWLGYSLLVLAVVLLWLALFPVKDAGLPVNNYCSESKINR